MNRHKLFAMGLVLLSPWVMAQTPPPEPAPAPTPRPATATVPADKLASDFSSWAGSNENSSALVQGLRSGTPITLTTKTPSGEVVSTSFAPGTKPMGYGNVRIALSLARTQLASQGITNPTPAQLQYALVGSNPTNTAQQGILQMRASGMGWGQIANSMGVKLGAVMSGKPAVTTTATGAANVSGGDKASPRPVTASGSAGSSAGGRGSGITNASGQGAGSRATSGLGNAAGGGAAAGAAGSRGGGQGQGGGKP